MSAVVRIPCLADTRTRFIDADAVSAVRADGHYTILYSRASRLFCPWSITEAEVRLPPALFVRTHRRYLVNASDVTSFERRKDTGVCYFEDTGALSKVPVSRTRLGEVRKRPGM